MCLGHTSNLALGIGNGRNAFKSIAPPTPSIAPSSLLSPANMAQQISKLVRKPTMKQSKGTRTVVEYSAVMDLSTGNLMCPEASCDLQFDNLQRLLSHWVMRSLNGKQCVICKKELAVSAKNNRSPDKQTYEVHLDRHFPDRYPCAGECGILDCDWVIIVARISCTTRRG
jgi:hypothetical protein